MTSSPTAGAPTTAPVAPLRMAAGVLAALGVFPLANLLTGGRDVPWWSAAVADWMTAGLGLVLLAVLIAALAGDRADDLIGRAARGLDSPSPRVFAAATALLVLVLSAALAQYCFSGGAFTGDEMAQRFHARILVGGRLFLPAEAHREFFATPEVLDGGGRWFSQFPVGGPAVLALGMLVRVPWLVNPVLAAITTVNVYRFASRCFDETTARGATLLFALSPFVLIMSASGMNHVATLACVSMALAELPVWAASAEPAVVRRSAVLVGVALGLAAMVRPMDAALAAAAIGTFQVTVARREQARRGSLFWQAAAGAVPVALLLWVNARTTGHALLFGYDALNGPGHRPGFHPDPQGVPFTPYRALATTSGYLMTLNRYLFEWPVPALAVIIAGMLAARRASRWELLLLGLLGAVVVGYALYWFNGYFAGPRFLYTALPALVVFAARAPVWIAARLREGFRSPTGARAALLVVPLCTAYAWTMPHGMSSVLTRARYYRQQYRDANGDVERQVASAGLTHALVFVPGTWRARTIARLQGLGMPPQAAASLLDTTDVCALQTALDAEDTLAAPTTRERLARVLAAGRAAGRAAPMAGVPDAELIAVVPGSRPTAACLREFTLDRRRAARGAPVPDFARFLELEHIDAAGRLGGPVVFARDLGPRNTLLRGRFGDRTWYEYRPTAGAGASGPVFVRLGGPPTTAAAAP